MGGEGKCVRFWRESPKERDHSEIRVVDGMGSEWILVRLAGGGGGGWVELIQLTQNRVWWRAVVSAVMKLRFLPPWGWLVS
jgi:hypothetical protein